MIKFQFIGVLSLPQRGRGTTKWWMRRSPFCGFHVFCEPCFVANESLCHKTKSTKQRVARLDSDLLIHHFVVPLLRWRRLFTTVRQIKI